MTKNFTRRCASWMFATVFATIALAVDSSAYAQAPKKPPPTDKPASQAPSEPVSQKFAVACSFQMYRKFFIVDPDGKTVDGAPAVFNDIRITWATTSNETVDGNGGNKPKRKKIVVNHELNRIEGAYRSWKKGESGENAPSYGCEKAAAKKF